MPADQCTGFPTGRTGSPIVPAQLPLAMTHARQKATAHMHASAYSPVCAGSYTARHRRNTPERTVHRFRHISSGAATMIESSAKLSAANPDELNGITAREQRDSTAHLNEHADGLAAAVATAPPHAAGGDRHRKRQQLMRTESRRRLWRWCRTPTTDQKHQQVQAAMRWACFNMHAMRHMHVPSSLESG